MRSDETACIGCEGETSSLRTTWTPIRAFTPPSQVLGHPRFLAVVFLALFAAAQLMFWKREAEAAARQRSAAARERRGVGATAVQVQSP